MLWASAVALWAQQPEVSIETPPQNKYTYWLLKPFHMEKRVVTPIKLTNSPRLEQLVRSGNLYLCLLYTSVSVKIEFQIWQKRS